MSSASSPHPMTRSSLLEFCSSERVRTCKNTKSSEPRPFDYCVHCRQRLSSPVDAKVADCNDDESTDNTVPALRCSRCKVVHYCSRSCQKLNFSIHKKRCKLIHNLGETLGFSLHGGSEEEKLQRHKLAACILELAFISTDTIDRGRSIYDLALIEYYKILQLDFAWDGALESVLLLMAILEYDTPCQLLIDYALNANNSNAPEKNQGSSLSEWVYGYHDDGSPTSVANAADILLGDYHAFVGRITTQRPWGPNNFLVPFFLIQLREETQPAKSRRPLGDLPLITYSSSEVGRKIEFATDYTLPFLRSLFPDSRQRWEQYEACALLTSKKGTLSLEQDDTDENDISNSLCEKSCLTFWMMLKDSVAYTPGMIDALEKSIDYMQDHLGYHALPEDQPGTPSASAFANFVKTMAAAEARDLK